MAIGKVLAAALQQPESTVPLPVRLTIGATWMLDREAAAAFKQHADDDNYFDIRIIYA